MKATDVHEALAKRYPPGTWVTIPEAPDSASNMGRKIDLLAIHCWQSRGHTVEAVEIKVTYADWKRERDNPGKADHWWRHSHRFWVAAPTKLSDRILPELPETWGLLAIDDDLVAHVVVEADRHQAQPFNAGQIVGLLRASRGTGLTTLEREFNRGRETGRVEGEARARQLTSSGRLEQLEKLIADAEAATGIPLTDWAEGFRADHATRPWGYASKDELLAALTVVVTDPQAVKQARRALEQTIRNLGYVVELAQTALDAPNPNREG